MNMHWVDWLVVAALATLVIAMAIYTRRFTRSVADFLAANRSAGRYVISVSEGAAALGAISVVGAFEQYYEAGFAAVWWNVPVLAIGFVTALTGWVIYRFRRTRALTMAQFFEMRYSRRFRIFAGILAFVSGIINFGIFPAVGAHFFIHFCGLPESFIIAGVSLSTFVTITVVLLGVSLSFTFMGGQVAVIVTDFIQGLFCLVTFLVIFVTLSRQFSWEQIAEAVSLRPENASLVNPLKITETKGFDIYFFLVAIFAAFYLTMGWQGTSGYNSSARNPHEAKMGKVLGKWREIVQSMLILLMPICVYTFLHHPDFAERADAVRATLSSIDSEQIRKQMTVPVALASLLPRGIMGALCAAMLAAFISTHDTYLHAWGSIFIQDVVLPFRNKPLSPARHMLILRLATCGVAVFIFCFSLVFRQTEYILMFFAITGAIFLGGCGSVIIGGLYWKRGTTSGAWAAMIVGATLAVGGIIVRQRYPDFPYDGQRLFFVAMVSAILAYVLGSLLSRKPKIDMDEILHRGDYAIEDDTVKTAAPNSGGSMFRMGPEYTTADRIVNVAFIVWLVGWSAMFLVGTVYAYQVGISDASWMTFWRYYVQGAFVLSSVTVVWFLWGGLRDLRDMFRRLATMARDQADDGIIQDSPAPSDTRQFAPATDKEPM